LKRNWERFGRRDPLWAIITDPERRRGKWDEEEFFRSGAAEIEAVLRHASEIGLNIGTARALDFGCGVGRLTQAMAVHFGRCDGVDISSAMVERARRYNHHTERCSYHLNDAPDLSIFSDASFDFVYSTLVLQHVEPQLAAGYIRELIRVLAPQGVLVFQLPNRGSDGKVSPDEGQTAARGPLPAAAFRAAVFTDAPRISARPGQEIRLQVTVENRSPHPWPASPDVGGRYQINVGNHWLRSDRRAIQRDDARCPLWQDVAPGGRGVVTLGVTAPTTDGGYWLELDLVQEGVGWFGELGSATLCLPCAVGTGVPPVPPEAAAPDLPPFRERHPKAFRLLSATRTRDAYWACRRGLDRARSARDRAIVLARDRWYTPYAPTAINWWRRGPLSPRMEMHGIPRPTVLSVVAAAGGRTVEVEPHAMPNHQSFRYWITKD